ncbi:unnamed protein product [Ectocarpus sp. CCAP 1310/34]|nr:unnamed protein product [Ectocarpus sp. CCAP 1310/34]
MDARKHPSELHWLEKRVQGDGLPRCPRTYTFASTESATLRGPRNVGRWSVEEHDRFVIGLQEMKDMKADMKKWEVISVYVGTRNAKQVQTHAQKCWKNEQEGILSPRQPYEISDFGEDGRGDGSDDGGDDDDDDGNFDQTIGERFPPSSGAAALAAAVGAAGAAWSYLPPPTHLQRGSMPASVPTFDGRAPSNGIGSSSSNSSYASSGWGVGGNGSSTGGFVGGGLPVAGGGTRPPLLGPNAALGGHHASWASPLGDPRAAVCPRHLQQLQQLQLEQQHQRLHQQRQQQQQQQQQQHQHHHQHFMMPHSEGDGMSGGGFGGVDPTRLALSDADPFENWPPSVGGELSEADLLALTNAANEASSDTDSRG